MRIFISAMSIVLALLIGSCGSTQRAIADKAMNGYCVFTFIYDSVTDCYYPKKSVFIDSITNESFSLITPANLESYSRHCGRDVQTPVQKFEPYFGNYTFARDSAFRNVFLEGNFYSGIQSQNLVYAVLKFKGSGIVITTACKEYLNDHLVNNWNVKQAEICHDFLSLPQVYLNSAGAGSLLTESEKLKLGMKDMTEKRIRYCTCL